MDTNIANIMPQIAQSCILGAGKDTNFNWIVYDQYLVLVSANHELGNAESQIKDQQPNFPTLISVQKANELSYILKQTPYKPIAYYKNPASILLYANRYSMASILIKEIASQLSTNPLMAPLEISSSNILIEFPTFKVQYASSMSNNALYNRNPYYCSPEEIANGMHLVPNAEASAIYSLGLLAMEIILESKYSVTDYNPLSRAANNAEFIKDLKSKIQVGMDATAMMLLSVIEKMLDENPNSRPKISELLTTIPSMREFLLSNYENMKPLIIKSCIESPVVDMKEVQQCFKHSADHYSILNQKDTFHTLLIPNQSAPIFTEFISKKCDSIPNWVAYSKLNDMDCYCTKDAMSLLRNKLYLQENKLLYVSKLISDAMKLMSGLNKYYGSISPESIYVDQANTVKILHSSNSKYDIKISQNQRSIFPINHISPIFTPLEVVNEFIAGKKECEILASSADIYSLGMTILYLLTNCSNLASFCALLFNIPYENLNPLKAAMLANLNATDRSLVDKITPSMDSYESALFTIYYIRYFDEIQNNISKLNTKFPSLSNILPIIQVMVCKVPEKRPNYLTLSTLFTDISNNKVPFLAVPNVEVNSDSVMIYRVFYEDNSVENKATVSLYTINTKLENQACQKSGNNFIIELPRQALFLSYIDKSMRLYAIGGKSNGEMVNHFGCIENSSLTELPSMMHNRMDCGATKWCQYIAVAGGGDETTFNPYLKTAELYSISQNKWNSLPDLSAPRLGCSLYFNNKNLLYIFSGKIDKELTSFEMAPTDVDLQAKRADFCYEFGCAIDIIDISNNSLSSITLINDKICRGLLYSYPIPLNENELLFVGGEGAIYENDNWSSTLNNGVIYNIQSNQMKKYETEDIGSLAAMNYDMFVDSIETKNDVILYPKGMDSSAYNELNFAVIIFNKASKDFSLVCST